MLSVILAGAVLSLSEPRFDNIDPSSHHNQITLGKLIKAQTAGGDSFSLSLGRDLSPDPGQIMLAETYLLLLQLLTVPRYR